jgi:Zn-dependent protease
VENIDPGVIAIQFAVFLFSLSIHECAHALAANWSGDPTGRYQGRITLNPMAHIDPIGTVILPLSMMIFGGGMMFGWAKPVPFNPLNLRNRKLGEILIAAAGPASNLVLMVICAVLMKIFFYSDIVSRDAFGDVSGAIFTILQYGIVMNIVLAVFNMIPIPPLDGSHILRNVLPDTLADRYSQLSPLAGFVILILLVNIGVTGWLATPILNFVNAFLRPGL